MSYKIRIDDMGRAFYDALDFLYANYNFSKHGWNTCLAFKKVYGIKLIAYDQNFEEMVFKNKAAYVLFMMQWR
jgi:hypothetical protein